MPPSEHELRLRARLRGAENPPPHGGAENRARAGEKISAELDRLQKQIDKIGEEATDEEIWKKVELARHDQRPYTLDYVQRLLRHWFGLHCGRAPGDRRGASDA